MSLIVFSPEYVGEPQYWVPYGFMRDEIECPFYILGDEARPLEPVPLRGHRAAVRACLRPSVPR